MGLIIGDYKRDYKVQITVKVGEDYGWEGVYGLLYKAQDWTDSKTD